MNTEYDKPAFTELMAMRLQGASSGLAIPLAGMGIALAAAAIGAALGCPPELVRLAAGAASGSLAVACLGLAAWTWPSVLDAHDERLPAWSCVAIAALCGMASIALAAYI